MSPRHSFGVTLSLEVLLPDKKKLSTCGLGLRLVKSQKKKSESVMQRYIETYLIIVTDAADAVSVNFFGRFKFLQISREKLAFSTDFTRKVAFFTDLTRKIGVFRCKFYSPKILPV